MCCSNRLLLRPHLRNPLLTQWQRKLGRHSKPELRHHSQTKLYCTHDNTVTTESPVAASVINRVDWQPWQPECDSITELHQSNWCMSMIMHVMHKGLPKLQNSVCINYGITILTAETLSGTLFFSQTPNKSL